LSEASPRGNEGDSPSIVFPPSIRTLVEEHNSTRVEMSLAPPIPGCAWWGLRKMSKRSCNIGGPLLGWPHSRHKEDREYEDEEENTKRESKRFQNINQ